MCFCYNTYRLSDLEIINNEEDDDISTPFYTAFQQRLIGLVSQHTALALEVVKLEPPQGLPAYIQFAVFRT